MVLTAMSQEPKQHVQLTTLREMAGLNPLPARLGESVLILIDVQREYLDGALPLEGIEESLDEIARVLAVARDAATPIIHIVQHGRPGGPICNPDGPFVQIIPKAAPLPGEKVIVKSLPNSFAGTSLEDEINATGRKKLIVVGYMTHMCVSTTVRAAIDRQFEVTVVGEATGTRPLPGTYAGPVSANMLKRATLAALADRFAIVVPDATFLFE
jgi:nicotinamidase-related amidase